MEIKIVLAKSGLTKNESAVYIALLRTGVMTSGEILKKSGINTGKIYDILERLKTKGLVSETTINNVRHFSASPPSQILKYLEKTRLEIESNENEIKALLPNMEKMRSINKQQTFVKVYTGYRGVETAMDEAIIEMKCHDEIIGMGSYIVKHNTAKRFWNKYIRIRIRKKISTRVIFSEKSDYYKEYKKMKYSRSRVLEMITPVTAYVYGQDRVLIFNYEDPPSCIVICDKRTATSFKHFFEQLWSIAKE